MLKPLDLNIKYRGWCAVVAQVPDNVWAEVKAEISELPSYDVLAFIINTVWFTVKAYNANSN